MPAQPKPQVKPRPPKAERGVPQELFAEAAASLAEKLGWGGEGVEDDWVQNDIQVSDARAYIQKVMHEHHQAAAQGLEQPDYQAACQHLAVDTPEEQRAIDAALSSAYESGRGAELDESEARRVNLAATLEVSAATALDKLSQAKG